MQTGGWQACQGERDGVNPVIVPLRTRLPLHAYACNTSMLCYWDTTPSSGGLGDGYFAVPSPSKRLIGGCRISKCLACTCTYSWIKRGDNRSRGQVMRFTVRQDGVRRTLENEIQRSPRHHSLSLLELRQGLSF